MIMWQELLSALALMFVFEGVLPFLSPDALRRSVASIQKFDDKTLRFFGLASMLTGLLILSFVK
jgi:uncharacterized protein YjeT (DUF2065 family)